MLNTNTPYVKKYSKKGELANPIERSFNSKPYPNRRERREVLQKDRAMSNSKNYPLVVLGVGKYRKYVQVINGKRIYHSAVA